jgi:predicted  nucleic acid-binding Zn-ribbon protein
LSKRHLLGAAAAVAALAAPNAFAAGDPVAAVNADLAKLKTDVASARATIVPTAQKLASDAAAAKGSTRAQAVAVVKPDLMQLRSALKAARTQIRADRAQLKTDLAAAKSVDGTRKQLQPAVKSTRAAVKADRTAIRNALQQARQAVKDLRASFRK